MFNPSNFWGSLQKEGDTKRMSPSSFGFSLT